MAIRTKWCIIQNRTKCSKNKGDFISFSVRGTDNAKKFDYVIYKPDGNVETTKYKVTIYDNNSMSIKPGYSASISNSSEDTIYVFCPKKVIR